MSNTPLDRRLIQVVPSARQIALQEMEFYAFAHFTVNTFTDREWGDGTEDPTVFDPTRFDPDQWVAAIRSAGMTGLILTCKHHDGFCLWPSRLTDHTVAASGYHGDVVGEVAAACKRGGVRFGVYLSPWDRHEPRYGSGAAYDDFFVGQLTELLTNYGDIFCVWFDGACGEGPNGKRQYYDWERYYRTVRALQPGATIHVCGPDVRWCGNEAGDTREAEWSVVPRRTMDTEKVAAKSQQADDDAFRQRKISAADRDLGSRAVLADERELIWYPAEVNTSIRPGWFWHASEDGQVKPLEKLIDIYEKSVGGNATFLLNIPPTREGRFHENDVARLAEFGAYLRENYGNNLLDDATLEAAPAMPGHEIERARTVDGGYYMPLADESDAPTTVVARWSAPKPLRRVVLMEQPELSQRIERCAVDVWDGGAWRQAAECLTVGHKRILRLDGAPVSALRIRIEAVRVAPAIRFIGAD